MEERELELNAVLVVTVLVVSNVLILVSFCVEQNTNFVVHFIDTHKMWS